jgi:hypothetical protein
MSRSDKPAWLLFLMVAVPSSVLSCLITIWIVNPAPISEPVLMSSEGEIAGVLQELRELRARLDVGFRIQSVRISEASAPVRQPVLTTNPQVDRLANIAERMDRLLRLGRPIAAESLATQRDAPINWSELLMLVELHRQDAKTVQVSVQLLTPKEVVARFGFPSNVQSRNKRPGMVWSYYRRDRIGKPDGRVLFTFTDGYVTSLYISMPDR